MTVWSSWTSPPRRPRSGWAGLVGLVLAAGLLLPTPGARSQEDADSGVHRVRRGENLTTIAQRYGTTVEELRARNGLRGSRILVGQRLRLPTPDHEVAVVRRGDTLSRIARRYDVPLDLLRQINDLPGDRIYPGQKLKLRPSHEDEVVHVVLRGETLSEIAQDHRMGLSRLRELNGLRGDRIYVGQKLRLREVSREVHVVEPGDALWEIARAYGLSVRELRDLNGLRDDRIYPGQELRVGEAARTAPPAHYTVRRGDTLGEIAQLHQMSLSELRSMNGLRSSTIHPGQRLEVRPILGGSEEGLGLLSPTEIPWNELHSQVTATSAYLLENGPYFYSRPRADVQKSNYYFERPGEGPRAAYARALRLWESFEKQVQELGRLSHRLDGWSVVIDPGHGGVDPGTIVRSIDGNGEPTYVVEDEYVHDIALRAYVLLTLHGADVKLTLLSPNHLIRGNVPATATFVHEQNEVFHSASINASNRASCWPKGGSTGLSRRRAIAEEHFRRAHPGRRVFLSLHADNSPDGPDAKTVFYHRRGGQVDRASQRFANALLPALGAKSRIRGRNLGVLRGNEADVAVLLEVRNLSYKYEAWALRFEQLRQRDAEKIVKGLLDWAERQAG